MLNLILTLAFMLVLLALAVLHGPPRILVKVLHAWHNLHLRFTGASDFPDVREGTRLIAEWVDPATLRRLRELRARSDEAHAECEAAFQAEAVRLGLSMERGEYGFLFNLVSGWAEK